MDLKKNKEQFSEHVLTEVMNTQNHKIFTFAKPEGHKSRCHLYQRWIIDKGTLIITGDCYPSIYRFNNTGLTLDFFKNCDLSYFSSKCVADMNGSKQNRFDEEYALEAMKTIVCEYLSESCYEDKEIYEADYSELLAKVILLKEELLRDMLIMEQQLNDIGTDGDKNEFKKILTAHTSYLDFLGSLSRYPMEGSLMDGKLNHNLKDYLDWDKYTKILEIDKFFDVDTKYSDIFQYYDKQLTLLLKITNIDFDDTWNKATTEEQFTLITPVIEYELGLSHGGVSDIFRFDTEQDAYGIMMDEQYNFMFGRDAYEHSLRTKTATPYFHLAALHVAADKYENALTYKLPWWHWKSITNKIGALYQSILKKV